MRDYYLKEWANAEKEGNKHYAQLCKLKYKCLLKEALKEPYKQYIDVLSVYPPLYLN